MPDRLSPLPALARALHPLLDIDIFMPSVIIVDALLSINITLYSFENFKDIFIISFF